MIAVVIATLITITGCGTTANKPYEPPTPAPSAHEGTFVSEHGTMIFNGDGSEIIINFDSELSDLTGIPEGEKAGTYVFLSGVLPPAGKVPVRYDTAHELQITIDDESVGLELGLASADGSTTTISTETVTPDRIPICVLQEGKYITVMFNKE